jgi:hypothetical protein
MKPIPPDWSTAHESFHIFECIPPSIDWQIKQRSAADITTEIKAGLNFSIILSSACYIEGNFERILIKNINTTKATDAFHERLINDLRIRISKTTGSEGYDEIFELIVGSKASKIINNQSLWENVKALFLFRNVIAHGRAVGYKLHFPPNVGGFWEEEFSGGYKKVEDFLLKKKLIQSRHIEEASNWHYFSDEVADFFWSIASTFVFELNKVSMPAYK